GSPFAGVPGAPARADRGARGGKKGKRGVDQGAVADNIRNTLRDLRGAPTRGGRRRDDDGREELEAARVAQEARERTTVRVNEFITVSELAGILKVPPTQIVGFALKNLGLMVTINQRLDFDQIDLIASEFGFQAVREEEYAADLATEPQPDDTEEELTTRPPVVTIMGHVDHGKTSLLDYIRKANVVAGEAGGITQHIGAYHVSLPNKRQITFLDTPGHEAFTAMRARGAQVTDIVVLVVAADDGLMPQTIEAISHARNAGVPMIVAINKIDLPQANALRVKQELLQQNVVLEDFGGTVLSTEISAKLGTNVDELLEQILLQADLLELRANSDRRATGAVIEAQLDPGKGPVATVLVQNGTLRVGNDFICGMYSGRVRALLDERGKAVKSAGPAIPVQVLGLTGVPMAGDQFLEVDDATQAREIAQRRERLDREAKSRRTSKSAITLEEFMKEAPVGEKRTLKLLIKADQGGPAEALADALGQLSTGEVAVEIVQRGVGAITEGDILLAKASAAIIIGFHVRPDTKARTAAEREGVDIKLYRIIYEAVSDVRAALEGLLAPEQREVVLGEAEVRELFKVPRIGTIAGASVRSGTFTRGTKVRVVRDGVEVYDGNLGSLRRFKDDVREVQAGFECGIGVENFNDLKVGDVIECYRTEQVARTLQASAAAG
ncbi:MAG TPA: translation initiation factor IF-2, partial [Gemmatirosa sp.]